MFGGNKNLFYFRLVWKHSHMLSVNVDTPFNLNAFSKIITHPSHLSNVLGTTVHVQRGWSLCPVSGLSLPQLSVKKAAKYSPPMGLGRTCDSGTANSRISKCNLMRAIPISHPLSNPCYVYILSIRYWRDSDVKPYNHH